MPQYSATNALYPMNQLSLPTKTRPVRYVWLEVGLIFVVFFLHAAWPVPDVNEAHYLSKALHFWDSSWCPGDFFLESNATHWTFYVTFGWLTLLFPLPVVAWIGRIVTWLLLAWSWRRLSWSILPARWWSIGTATLFVFLVEHFHMAGEWVVGGVEAKGFAFVLVFVGMERMVCRRWNATWIAFGAAAMFHVLVGGWAVVAGLIAWLIYLREGKDETDSSEHLRREGWFVELRKMTPGLIVGGLLSLPGLLPAMMMGHGVSTETADFAHRLYVFIRLGHHLNPGTIPTEYVIRFAVLLLVWLGVRHLSPKTAQSRLLHGFIAGSVTIAIVGFAIGLVGQNHPSLVASLLRFYWFRLSDIMVPLGVAIGAPSAFLAARHAQPRLVRAMTVAVVLLGIWHLGGYAMLRPFPIVGRYYSLQGDCFCWRQACEWVARSETIPEDAVFLTPRLNQTFRWYANRPEVANWKDIPQDPESLKAWWQRILDLHATGSLDPLERWYPTLASQSPDQLRRLGRRYGASYVITVSRPPVDLPLEYGNGEFSVYRLDEEEGE